jgi:hypothetical protein
MTKPIEICLCCGKPLPDYMLYSEYYGKCMYVVMR